LKLPFGIVRCGPHLAYGFREGWFQWAPGWVQHAIVGAWNFVSCRIYGHDYFGLPEEGIESRCVNCSKKGP
jgi:hypothetical protein